MIKFSVELLETVREDIRSGRYADLDRTTLSDDEITGLRAVVTKNSISFHMSYHVSDDIRSNIYLGKLPELSLIDARKIAMHIRDLAQSGIDVQEELRKKLIADITKSL